MTFETGTPCRAVNCAEQVFHFAAQVAVTTSLLNPSEDFAINALGTFNLLEELRERGIEQAQPWRLADLPLTYVSDGSLPLPRFDPESSP